VASAAQLLGINAVRSSFASKKFKLTNRNRAVLQKQLEELDVASEYGYKMSGKTLEETLDSRMDSWERMSKEAMGDDNDIENQAESENDKSVNQRLLELLELSGKKCEGCGIQIQVKDPEQDGYMKKSNFLLAARQILGDLTPSKNDNAETMVKTFEIFEDHKPQSLRDFEELEQKVSLRKLSDIEKMRAKKQMFKRKRMHMYEITDVNEMIQLEQDSSIIRGRERDVRKQLKPKRMVCQRCVKLRNDQEIEKNPLLGHRFDPQKMLKEIFSKIEPGSVIIKLVDIADMGGSFLPDVWKLAEKNKNQVILVVNKEDLLPDKYSRNRIYSWIRRSTLGLVSEEVEKIALVSSKTGHGFNKVFKLIEEAKERLHANRSKKDKRPNLYVIGCANAGKSTFLNTLAKRNRNTHTNHEVNLSHHRSLVDLQKELTESSIPGTTLEFTRIKNFHLDFTVYDTPGIPNPAQITTYMEDPKAIIKTIPKKQLKPFTFVVRPGESVWLGGLVRIDLLTGKDLLFTYFLSQDVSVHRVSTQNATDSYERLAGKKLVPCYWADGEGDWSKFEQYQLSVENRSRKFSGSDLAISGLGWIGLTGWGKNDMKIHLPPGVEFYLRDSLMPHEIRMRGVQKWKGHTITSKMFRK